MQCLDISECLKSTPSRIMDTVDQRFCYGSSISKHNMYYQRASIQDWANIGKDWFVPMAPALKLDEGSTAKVGRVISIRGASLPKENQQSRLSGALMDCRCRWCPRGRWTSDLPSGWFLVGSESSKSPINGVSLILEIDRKFSVLVVESGSLCDANLSFAELLSADDWNRLKGFDCYTNAKLQHCLILILVASSSCTSFRTAKRSVHVCFQFSFNMGEARSLFLFGMRHHISLHTR